MLIFPWKYRKFVENTNDIYKDFLHKTFKRVQMMYPSIVSGKTTYVLQNHLTKHVGLFYFKIMKQNQYISFLKNLNFMFKMKTKVIN